MRLRWLIEKKKVQDHEVEQEFYIHKGWISKADMRERLEQATQPRLQYREDDGTEWIDVPTEMEYKNAD